MGLNVQSGHSKVVVQVHSFFFCDSSVIHRLFLLLPLLQPPAIYPTELCWWGKPARTLPRTRSSLSSLSSLSPCLFLLSSFFSPGQGREELLGPWAPLTVLFPSATHLSLPGLRGMRVGGQAWMHTHSSLSFTLDWGGRRAGREGGLLAGCALPGPIQHPLRLWSPHFLLPKAWSSQVEAAFDGASVPTTSLFRSTSRSCFSSFLFPFLLSFLSSFPPVSLFSLLSRVLVSRNVGKGPAVQPRDQAKCELR